MTTIFLSLSLTINFLLNLKHHEAKPDISTVSWQLGN